MRKSTKGFYTLEASIFLPLVILAVLSLGYFIRIEGMWENCIHGAVDESTVIAARSANGAESVLTASKVRGRIEDDNPGLDSIEINDLRTGYSDLYEDELISYRIKAMEKLSFPLGFRWEFHLDNKIRFRAFVGKEYRGSPLGAEGLETETSGEAVWIFPQSGRKYHKEECTYVKASVSPMILTGSLKSKYKPCALCRSGEKTAGSIVYCFEGSDTSYHRGTCRSIVRRTVVIDRSEAVKKGYGPCSKCGG